MDAFHVSRIFRLYSSLGLTGNPIVPIDYCESRLSDIRNRERLFSVSHSQSKQCESIGSNHDNDQY